MSGERLDDLKRFYELTGKLGETVGGARVLAECNGRLQWPRRGVYFHRGSIFRLIVGTALITKHGHNFPTWDDRTVKASADIRVGEMALEREVSKTIGAMQFLWLGVDDEPGYESARGYIERNAIALLSNFEKEPIDPPSSDWLGHQCSRERVRKSGIWNQNHVDERYDPAFLDKLEALIGVHRSVHRSQRLVGGENEPQVATFEDGTQCVVNFPHILLHEHLFILGQQKVDAGRTGVDL